MLRPWLLALVSACGVPAGSEPEPSDVEDTTTPAPPDDTATTVRTYADGLVAPTGDGRLSVALWLSGGAVRGRHDVTLSVRDANGPASGLAVNLVATMPAHGHGTRPVVVTASEVPGEYAAEGLVLTMVGAWRIEVTATEGARTSRAAFLLSVDDP